MATPPVRFVTAADGVRLAYAVYGDGPPLVWAAHWLTHLEYAWESPVWRHMVEFLARHFTVVRYDQRGCGLSDWTDRGLDLDTWVADLGVIVDAIGFERFDLLGMSQGGPIAIEYAVRHPERVRNLILYGSFSCGAFIPAEQREVLGQLIEIGWGQSNPAFRQFFTSQFIPDATDEQRNWFNTLQKKSASPALAAQIYRAIQTLDVTDRLPLVTQPTLVLHARGDAAIPFEAGRALAAGIPNARLVPLAGDNHLVLETTPGWPVFCREVAALIGADAHALHDMQGTRATGDTRTTDDVRAIGDTNNTRAAMGAMSDTRIADDTRTAEDTRTTRDMNDTRTSHYMNDTRAANDTRTTYDAHDTPASDDTRTTRDANDTRAAGAPRDERAPLTQARSGTYRFGACVVDDRARELRRDGEVVPIEHRAYDLLVYLIANHERAISKDELQEAVWPRMVLTESALTRCVMKARRAVGDDSQRQAVIKTVHGHGYRFVAPLERDG